MLNLMLITNRSQLAKNAIAAGVNRIFVDLEYIGKKERQGHMDTWISGHSLEDAFRIREAIPDADLLVRLNPPQDGLEQEVENALKARPDFLMLPMFNTAEELTRFCKAVDGRAGVIPLVETPEAAGVIKDLVQIPGVTEIYIGLNDLHLGLKLNFMFEPLANGMVDDLAGIIRQAKVPFGFGGIARIGEGQLPGELVLGEHLRVGSSCVILSRTFQRGMVDGEFADYKKLNYEIEKLRESEEYLSQRTEEQIELDREKVVQIVNLLARASRKK